MDLLLDKINMDFPALLCNDISCTEASHKHNIDDVTEQLINIAIQSGRYAFPSCVNSHIVIPRWDEEIQPLKESSLFWHHLWLQCDKPKKGVVYDIMKSSRAKYHLAIRNAKKCEQKLKNQMFAESIQNSNYRHLWNEIKRMNRSGGIVSDMVDSKCGDNNICNVFFDKYAKLYQTVPTSADEIYHIQNEIKHRLNTSSYPNSLVQVKDVKQAFQKLKPGKHDGNAGIYSDHFIHASNKFIVCFSILLAAILLHGHTPKALLLSVLISIPKDAQASLCDSGNYRGIALSSPMCKIIDHWVLLKYGSLLQTSDYQYGFKKGHSTSLCTLILKETVSYFNVQNSSVYSCLLDASKAFDFVHYGKLFNILLDRNLPPHIIRLILDSYSHQTLKTRWGHSLSHGIDVKNGVKQGGVLSPILFALYMDELILRLKNSCFGCRIGKTYVGCLAYADDLTLLSPSIGGLKQVLLICEKFSQEFHVTFNSKKSLAICFGTTESPTAPIAVNGANIKWTTSVKHLGNILNSFLSDGNDITLKRGQFIQSVNKLLSQFGNIHSKCLSYLFNAYCSVFYGSQIWELGTHHLIKLFISWHKAIRKIWKVSPRCHVSFLCGLNQCMYISEQLASRFIKIYRNAYYSSNKIVSFFAHRAKYTATSTMGRNIAHLSSKYNMSYTELINLPVVVVKCKLLNHSNELSSTSDGATLHELCNIRDGILYVNNLFELENIEEIIEYVCVN